MVANLKKTAQEREREAAREKAREAARKAARNYTIKKLARKNEPIKVKSSFKPSQIEYTLAMCLAALSNLQLVTLDKLTEKDQEINSLEMDATFLVKILKISSQLKSKYTDLCNHFNHYKKLSNNLRLMNSSKYYTIDYFLFINLFLVKYNECLEYRSLLEDLKLLL